MLLLFASQAHADWPARVFAPYVWLGSNDGLKLTDCESATGQKHFTLAFIIADKNGKAAWFGREPLEKNLYAEQIESIRKHGGEVIISFGGAAGPELALANDDAGKLELEYQSAIDRYKFTWLDFDIEGKALRDEQANQRRNQAIAAIQKKNPTLRVTFTLPVNPNGISEHSQKMMADAKAKGIKIYSANIMVMDYGARISKDKKMGDLAIECAIKTRQQVEKIDPSIQIGLCPMIGQNDVKEEIFTLDDAKTLRDWASKQEWICSLSFWSANRDTGKPGRREGTTRSGIQQQPWEFTRIFQPFAPP
jgi:chitinase